MESNATIPSKVRSVVLVPAASKETESRVDDKTFATKLRVPQVSYFPIPTILLVIYLVSESVVQEELQVKDKCRELCIDFGCVSSRFSVLFLIRARLASEEETRAPRPNACRPYQWQSIRNSDLALIFHCIGSFSNL